MTLIYSILSLAVAANCPHKSATLGHYSFTEMKVSEHVGCTVSANASSKNQPTRRSLRFLEGGQITVFTEIDGVGGANSTGGRTLFILPADGSLDLKNSGRQSVQVQDSAGLHWNFDAHDNVQIEEKCKLKVNKSISWENESTDDGKDGGFLLRSCPNSIIFDSGFKRKSPANDNQDGHTKIRGSNGAECSVSNKEIYNYIKEGHNEYHPRIKPTKELYETLSKTKVCQELDFSPLNGAGNRQRSSQQR